MSTPVIMAPATTCIACGQPPRSTPDSLRQQVADLTAKLQQIEQIAEEAAAALRTAQTRATLLGQLAHEWISVACQESKNPIVLTKGAKAQGVLTGLGIQPAVRAWEN